MRTSTAIFFTALAFVVTGSSGAATPAGIQDRGGLVYRYYAGAGYRFQPLLSFANLQHAVSRRDASTARRLARALVVHGVRTGGALYWPYDFSFGGGPSSWTSGFTQAVAANALARAGVLLRDDSLETAAARAFAGLRRTLLLPMAGGGLWIREYSYTGQVILNAQLESVLELDSYAAIARTASARMVARVLERTSARLLPQFDLGCWGRYQLGGAAADTHYEAYHVDLLRRLAVAHPDPIWDETYLRWRRCLR
jgi:hypothetical protein